MKTILVDAGNQRIKLRELDADHSLVVCQQTQQFFDGLHDLSQPVRVLVSSVRSFTFKKRLLESTKDWQIQPRFLTIADVTGFRTFYQQPASLGIDRCLAMVGAVNKYTLPLIVVDSGTVVTVDAIDQEGVHTGGMFFPGLTALRQGMAESAESLQKVQCQEEFAGKGKTTRDCLCSGTITGWVSALSGIIDSLVDTVDVDGGEVTVVVCGGEGVKYLAMSGRDYPSDPDLVFEGMRVVNETIMKQ